MRALLLIVTLLATTPALLHAQPKQLPAVTPEALLPARSLLFYRYDGYEPHRQAYDKTALAKIMTDDLGDFIDHLLELATKQIVKGTFPQDGEEKKDDPPKKDPKAEAAKAQLKQAAALFPELLKYLWRHGAVISMEMPDVNRWQLHVVFPEGAAAKNRAVVLPLLQLLGEWGGQKMRTTQLEGRTIAWRSWRTRTADNPLPLPKLEMGRAPAWRHGLHLPLLIRQQDGPAQAVEDDRRRFAWWQEGNHVVFTIGTEPFESLLDVAVGRRPNATSAAWHQALAKFNSYETDMRGHVDLEQVIDLSLRSSESASPFAPLLERPLRRLIAARFGLRGLKSLSFHLGFAGKYQRSTLLVGVDPPQERQGILKLFSTPLAFDAKQLPPLPADADFVEVHRIDFERFYDELIALARAAAAVSALQSGNLAIGDIPDLDQLLGINTRKDLLAVLDSTVVVSGAHTEGPFIFGACVAIKAKDEKKLRRAMENLTVVLSQQWAANPFGIGGKNAIFQERRYRGVRLDVLQNGLPLTYAIHKGWLIMALTPQPVTGFIARADGRRTAWKLPPEAEETITAAKAQASKDTKLAAVWVSDPRRTMEIYLSLLPVFAGFAGPAIGLEGFDASKFPGGRAVTDHMFPHTTLLYDDGHAFRLESHYSMDVPGIGWWILLSGSMGLGWLF